MQKVPPTPKGFRDIAPELAIKRRKTINKIAIVLEEAGFVPIETPTIEFSDILEGKYGEEERLIYKFTDRGDRNLALRYDLTVPLARFIASNQQLIAKDPFSRYQLGQVFRGENPQAGRYREFTQLDFDTVGSKDIEEDARIVATAVKAARAVGVSKATMAINDRKNFEGVPIEVVRAIDKIHKVGKEGVKKELTEKGLTKSQIESYLKKLLTPKKSADFEKLTEILKTKSMEEGKEFFLDESLARGLDYYTGLIFELKIEGDMKAPSLGAGGRYDNLIGTFTKKDIPAVGFSFGVDRLIESIHG
jgi:histidyl-tRNA synthetase